MPVGPVRPSLARDWSRLAAAAHFLIVPPSDEPPVRCEAALAVPAPRKFCTEQARILEWPQPRKTQQPEQLLHLPLTSPSVEGRLYDDKSKDRNGPIADEMQ